MPYDLIIRDATLVRSSGREVADVAIEKGQIAYVGPRPPKPGRREISGIGKFLMPGVIDTAVQFAPNDDVTLWETESSAAVTGGITTAISLPAETAPVTTFRSAKNRATRISGRSWCNYAFWARASVDSLREVTEATRAGFVVGALATLHSKDDPKAISAEQLKDFRSYPGVVGIRLGSDEVDESEINDLATDIADILRDVATDNTRLHIVHLSTAAELQLIDPIRGDISITAGVTPHHLFLSLEQEGTVNTRPPVRNEYDRRSLWSAMKRGRLDCLASDHHPNTDLNNTGIPGTELLFPLMLCAVQNGRISIESLVTLCSERPAAIFEFPNKGKIEAGADADLILFAEHELSPVSSEALVSRAGWTPYERREVAPKPELVIVNGEIVAQHGHLIGSSPKGILIKRKLGEAA